ncbi:MAG: glycosyltransferase family A protein, partial [Acidobacteriota bacterium]
MTANAFVIIVRRSKIVSNRLHISEQRNSSGLRNLSTAEAFSRVFFNAPIHYLRRLRILNASGEKLMSNIPAVSVIIPAYNLAPYIAETLDSLFAQTYRDFEAILVNDGSTDDTEERIAPYRDRLAYIRQENKGVMAARNAGLKAAHGRYIALLDGDDVLLPRFLEVLVGMLEADQTLSVAYPNARY